MNFEIYKNKDATEKHMFFLDKKVVFSLEKLKKFEIYKKIQCSITLSKKN